MTHRDRDVIAAGHLCLDIIPSLAPARGCRIEEVFVPGKLVETGALAISTGGPVSNTGITLVTLGMRVAFMAKVGFDEIGRLTLELLKAWGDVERVSVGDKEHSSSTIVIALSGVDRIFLHAPRTNNAFSAKDVDYDW